MNNTTKRALAGALALGAIGWVGYSAYEYFYPPDPRVAQMADRRPQAQPTPTSPKPTAEQLVKSDADDELLMAALASKQRWVKLPKLEVAPQIDPSRTVWFSTFRSATPDEFKRSIERLARGETRIVRGGTLLLIDSTGRYWGHRWFIRARIVLLRWPPVDRAA